MWKGLCVTLNQRKLTPNQAAAGMSLLTLLLRPSSAQQRRDSGRGTSTRAPIVENPACAFDGILSVRFTL